MAITTFAQLETAVANWAHRGDLTTSQIDEFIALAESDLQVRAKLTQWDTEASVTITAGSGPLPSDFASMVSVQYGNESATLVQVSPSKYEYLLAATDAATPINYAIIGSTLRVVPIATGTAQIVYRARFTPLSLSATTNSLLTLFPDAYLNGAMFQFASWAEDDVKMQKYGVLFAGLDYLNPHASGGSVGRVKKYTRERRYGDAPLVMRVG